MTSEQGTDGAVGTKGWKRGTRWRWRGGRSQLRAPSARNNKQAFSYSNKYQTGGELEGAADKETGGEDGFSATPKPIFDHGPGRAEQAVTDL